MQSNSIIAHAVSASKIADYAVFIKFRLTVLVVFSALVGFIIVSRENDSTPLIKSVDWFKALWLTIAGFLVTGCANGFNQVIEKDYDKIMERTMMRPLPQQRMSINEGIVFASLIGIAGLIILWFFLNPLSCLLSALSIGLYVLAYTPLKRQTPFAVLVGSFPGAFPPLLGSIAATDDFGAVPFEGLVLFVMQFIWQFPHFWAIAWVMHEDYQKAGFHLLPSKAGRDKTSAFQVVIYTLFLFLMSMVPVIFGMTKSFIGPLVILICGIIFLRQAIKLYRDCSIKSARELMVGSFIYLPIVQLAILLG